MPPESASRDGQREPSAIFGRASTFLEQEGPVELLNVDPAVLDGLYRVRDLQQLARSLLWIGERSVGGWPWPQSVNGTAANPYHADWGRPVHAASLCAYRGRCTCHTWQYPHLRELARRWAKTAPARLFTDAPSVGAFVGIARLG
jgi:hypothetical protein